MTNFLRKISPLALFLGAIVIGSFFVITRNQQEKDDLDGKMLATASFYPVYFFASEIGGEHATLEVLIPAGTEPHDYELSSQDRARLEKSRLIILNGRIEPWGDTLSQSLAGKNAHIVVAGEGLFVEREGVQHDDQADPHVWLDPKRAAEMADRIAEGFIRVDPANREYYKNNLADLKMRLADLDSKYQQGLQTCERREFVSSHGAFGYIADRYGLTEMSIAGISPDEEPSPKKLIEVSEFVRKNNITTIFFERLLSPRLSETIARETGAQTDVLDPLEGLDSQSNEAGENYFSIMEKNLENLRRALSCQ